jgi:O-glycosyl hydrolase
MNIEKDYYYRFVYKDGNGQLGYTIVKITKQDNDLAIAKFDKDFPDLVWRRFEQVNQQPQIK